MDTIEYLRAQAYERGRHRGMDDVFADCYNEAPLSGEWAGESIEELLGDLMRRADRMMMDYPPDDFYEVYNEICDSYEQGYESAHIEGN